MTRGALAALGVALVLSGGFVSMRVVHVGDNYCGRVAWDTNRASPCAGEMRERTITTTAVVAVGVVLLLAATRWRLSAILVVVGLAFTVVAGNRLLEPIHEPLCGSVLHPSSSLPPELHAVCSRAVSSHRSQAALLGALAVLGFGGAIWSDRRRNLP